MLDEMVFRTEEVAAADRFDSWVERMGRTHAPMELRSDHTEDYRASQRVLGLGPVVVWPSEFQPVVFRRTRKLIRQSDPEMYHLSLLLHGTGAGVWGHHETAYRPLDLHVNSSSLDYELHSTGNPVRTVGVEIPQALVPLSHDKVRRIIARPMSAREGVGALLSGFLTQLAADTSAYRPSDAPRLGRVASDLVASLFAHVLEDENALPPETHQRSLTLRIQAFIRAHLHDPGLTPGSIAAAHHISVSYLHRLFQDEEDTVADGIRRLRLEAAHRDLTDPALGTTPIHAIATRWGFPRASTFSRAYRAAYGTTPKDHRCRAFTGGGFGGRGLGSRE
ncbi:helix-turn-helix domain-containing protein [Streptomyces coffeae]|uniref:Helix-turn-helix domain-containing protein n=1 Tax=Streptomyces coffeae TaxID=621382 RepID=A0ABS1NA24_9ACTN|nr:helix-turn-helix domain-containing protein [Streptomyces coffeae]MBL1096927.1 helix-turn-helix domain-containing protein [Streptomyces coffeae]